jgi:hypothetical protein
MLLLIVTYFLSMVCKYMYCMGDFNSRIRQLPDRFSDDDFQIPLHRIVKYVQVNNNGYKLIDLCKKKKIFTS